ncbi:MAG: hypothetical protein COW73_02760 [Nitrospirae bacterium CG18_big_fil_WC_8_21_14_2_50_70_55]|nr:MAG: hypothetical protein COW73_02760 [Nitrospirae bacterium CG18_big_fil_WC_8_21_14_2_50_70_55]
MAMEDQPDHATSHLATFPRPSTPLELHGDASSMDSPSDPATPLPPATATTTRRPAALPLRRPAALPLRRSAAPPLRRSAAPPLKK